MVKRILVVVGAAALMLLRICDKASWLSFVLVVVGMTALVYSVRHAGSKKDYSFIAGMIGVAYVVRFYGYTGDPVADLTLGLLIGLIMFALMGVEGFLKKFGDSLWYTLIFPAAYLLFMYFTEIVKINMPFRLDTYVSCFPVLCQITAICGIYSIDFLIAWTASVIVFLLDHREKRQGVISACAYAAVLCVVLAFGFVHMSQMNEKEQAKTDTVRVALVTGPYVGTFSDGSYKKLTMEETLTSFDGIMKEAAAEDAEILVFSEEAYGVSDQEEETLLGGARKLASLYNMHLLLAYEVADTKDN